MDRELEIYCVINTLTSALQGACRERIGRNISNSHIHFSIIITIIIYIFHFNESKGHLQEMKRYCYCYFYSFKYKNIITISFYITYKNDLYSLYIQFSLVHSHPQSHYTTPMRDGEVQSVIVNECGIERELIVRE